MTAMMKETDITGDGRLRRRDHPHRLPDPVPRGLRQAAGLSRQRRLGAEAALRARRDRPRLQDGIRQRPSRPALPLQRRHRRATRTRARPCAASSMRRASRRSSSRATPPRRINLVASSYGAWTSARATRSCSRSWSTTPTSCPGISTASARARCSSGRRSPTTATFLLDEFEKLLDQAHQDGRHHAHVERAGHRRADQGGRAHRARARHSGAGRRQPGRRAHAGRRAGPRLRLLRLHRPQDLRADRHRRALRQERAPRRHAALSWAAAR